MAGLLLACLLKMPYGFYQFVRIAGFILFSWLAYIEYNEHKFFIAIMCACIAILLNPIFKIYFTRDLWNKIDLIIATALTVWIIIDLLNKFFKRAEVQS